MPEFSSPSSLTAHTYYSLSLWRFFFCAASELVFSDILNVIRRQEWKTLIFPRLISSIFLTTLFAACTNYSWGAVLRCCRGFTISNQLFPSKGLSSQAPFEMLRYQFCETLLNESTSADSPEFMRRHVCQSWSGRGGKRSEYSVVFRLPQRAHIHWRH